ATIPRTGRQQQVGYLYLYRETARLSDPQQRFFSGAYRRASLATNVSGGTTVPLGAGGSKRPIGCLRSAPDSRICLSHTAPSYRGPIAVFFRTQCVRSDGQPRWFAGRDFLRLARPISMGPAFQPIFMVPGSRTISMGPASRIVG